MKYMSPLHDARAQDPDESCLIDGKPWAYGAATVIRWASRIRPKQLAPRIGASYNP